MNSFEADRSGEIVPQCGCEAGYALQPDRHTCKANAATAPLLVFSTRQQLQALDLRRGNTRSLLAGLRDTIAVTFLHNTSANTTTLFWTGEIQLS